MSSGPGLPIILDDSSHLDPGASTGYVQQIECWDKFLLGSSLRCDHAPELLHQESFTLEVQDTLENEFGDVPVEDEQIDIHNCEGDFFFDIFPREEFPVPEENAGRQVASNESDYCSDQIYIFSQVVLIRSLNEVEEDRLSPVEVKGGGT